MLLHTVIGGLARFQNLAVPIPTRCITVHDTPGGQFSLPGRCDTSCFCNNWKVSG